MPNLHAVHGVSGLHEMGRSESLQSFREACGGSSRVSRMQVSDLKGGNKASVGLI